MSSCLGLQATSLVFLARVGFSIDEWFLFVFSVDATSSMTLSSLFASLDKSNFLCVVDGLQMFISPN